MNGILKAQILVDTTTLLSLQGIVLQYHILIDEYTTYHSSISIEVYTLLYR